MGSQISKITNAYQEQRVGKNSFYVDPSDKNYHDAHELNYDEIDNKTSSLKLLLNAQETERISYLPTDGKSTTALGNQFNTTIN